jgi:hypothetical protein
LRCRGRARHGQQSAPARAAPHHRHAEKVPRRFVDETLWPEYTQLSDTLRIYLEEVTERVVSQVLQADGSEAAEAEEPRQLSLGKSRDET